MKSVKRTQSFVIVAFCYIAAGMAGLGVFGLLPGALWLRLLVADLAGTVVIWLTSQALKNASVYDPYWSVQPPIILGLTLGFLGRVEPGSILLVLSVTYWGARLTANWMITFPGLHRQDWRYDQLEAKSKGFFPLVNLFGIQIMPTLIVYACLLPGFYYLVNGGGLTGWTVVGLLLVLGGATLELLADRQMQVFRARRADRSELLRTGLWRHSRHPNYLGEITVWWGVYLVLLSVYPGLWYLGAGALLNTALFLFISIPMAEKHLAEYKTGYAAYRRETRMLLPIPKRK
jgi:steroid 5-alpha reductase family enzyme